VRILALIVVAFLPAIGGCVCDPPVERLAVKHPPHAKKAVAAAALTPVVPPAPAPAAAPVPVPAAAASVTPPIIPLQSLAKTKLRTIRVKSCDCPEDFDPQVCGDRKAYTSWSPNCASAGTPVATPTSVQVPTTTGSIRPSESQLPR
jgi:hypothetical protein